MSAHSSILALEMPWTEEPGMLQSMELQKSWAWLSTKQQQQEQYSLIDIILRFPE